MRLFAKINNSQFFLSFFLHRFFLFGSKITQIKLITATEFPFKKTGAYQVNIEIQPFRD